MLMTVACVGAFNDERETHYANTDAARADGGFTRGWIPEIVPDDASNIWERHDVSSNETWACFTTAADAAPVRERIRGLGGRPYLGGMGRSPREHLRVRPWWPETASAEAYEIIEHEGSLLLVGIDPANRKVCFHRTSTGGA